MNGQDPNVNNNVVGAPTSLGVVPNNPVPPVEGNGVAVPPIENGGSEVQTEQGLAQQNPTPMPGQPTATDATPVVLAQQTAPAVPSVQGAAPIGADATGSPVMQTPSSMTEASTQVASAPIPPVEVNAGAQTLAPDPMAQTTNMQGNTPNAGMQPVTPGVPVNNADMSAIPQPIPGTSAVSTNAKVNPIDQTNSNSFVEPTKVANIGAVPPPKKKEVKKGSNKIVFIILIVVLLAAIGFGVYYFLFLGKSSIEVVPKDLTSNLNVALSNDPNDYATITGTDSKNCTVSTLNVNITAVGEYQYTISCGGETFKGKITIVDEEVPEVVLKDVVVKAGSTVTGLDFIEACSKEKCTYSFVDATTLATNLQTPGEYKIEINVTDDSENATTVTGNLIVLSSDSNWILECMLEEEMTTYGATKTINDQYAINIQNNHSGYARRIITFVFDNANQYNQVVGDKEDTMTFDGITGDASYDDEANTLTIAKNLTDTELSEVFGGTIQTTYVGIRMHYTTLGYTFNLIDLSKQAE